MKPYIKKLVCVVLTVAVFAMSAGCDFLSPIIKRNTVDPKPSYVFDENSTRTPNGMVLKNGVFYLKDLDTGNAVEDYMLINAKVKDGTLPDVVKQTAQLTEAVMTDRMPVFHNSSFYAPETMGEFSENGASETHLTVRLVWSGKYSEDGEEQFSRSLIKILQGIIKDDMTEYEKVLAIHDYVSYNVVYNESAFNEGMKDDSNVNENNFNIVGAVYRQSAVCDGYANMFNVLCRLEGIRSVRVTGQTLRYKDGEPLLQNNVAVKGITYVDHAWNKVFIDADSSDEDNTKKWYNVDTTYDRIGFVFGNESKGFLRHAFFLLSDEDIAQRFPVTVNLGESNVSAEEGRIQTGISRFNLDTYISEDSSVQATSFSVRPLSDTTADLDDDDDDGVDPDDDDDVDPDDDDDVDPDDDGDVDPDDDGDVDPDDDDDVDPDDDDDVDPDDDDDEDGEQYPDTDVSYYDALETFDYFEHTTFAGKSLKVNSQDELNALFSALKDTDPKVGKIEVKLNFEHDDGHIQALKEAFSKASANQSANESTCKRSVNNVFFCILYQ